uniref:ABC-2 type transporter n=1 Tax=Erythrolobus coxiae TaxID=362235 RepID=UPI001FCDBB4B|nr:ABC-2 type transporter [Erythrolobus coxiae]UNJ17725.1 ABC-2 type transporter [Erythrolobus coxiae]
MQRIKKTTYSKLLQPKIQISKKYSLKEYYTEIAGLTERLFIQLRRRPSIALAGVIQPLLWLFLFGALFENLSIQDTSYSLSYIDFLAPGIIIFTAFSSALNAGLAIIFDREFGFLNRLLVYPLLSRVSILISSIIFIAIVSIGQSILLLNLTAIKSIVLTDIKSLLFVIAIIFFITIIISLISLNLAFILPGHIELLACILILNLPILFSSSALSPLILMPQWLKITTLFNPLTYAIEALRMVILKSTHFNTYLKYPPVLELINLKQLIFMLIILDCIAIFLSVNMFRKRY